MDTTQHALLTLPPSFFNAYYRLEGWSGDESDGEARGRGGGGKENEGQPPPPPRGKKGVLVCATVFCAGLGGAVLICSMLRCCVVPCCARSIFVSCRIVSRLVL